MTATYDALVDLLVDRFQVERSEIKPDVTFEDLELDSLFLVEFLLVVQSELGVEIREDIASPRDTLERAAERIAEEAASEAKAS